MMEKVNALWGLQSPPLHFGDGTQSALMPSILDKAFKAELSSGNRSRGR